MFLGLESLGLRGLGFVVYCYSSLSGVVGVMKA